MTKNFDLLKSFFQQDDWPFSELDNAILRMGFRGSSGEWNCYAQAREEQGQTVFYSVVPASTPPHKRMIMAEFLTMANFGLIVGNFELDLSDGQVRYKTSIDSYGGQLSQELIARMVYANVISMDQYLPGIMAIIYSDQSAEAAISQVETDE